MTKVIVERWIEADGTHAGWSIHLNMDWRTAFAEVHPEADAAPNWDAAGGGATEYDLPDDLDHVPDLIPGYGARIYSANEDPIVAIREWAEGVKDAARIAKAKAAGEKLARNGVVAHSTEVGGRHVPEGEYVMRDGKVSPVPVVVWENNGVRVVWVRSTYKVVIEEFSGRDAMGQEHWIESSSIRSHPVIHGMAKKLAEGHAAIVKMLRDMAEDAKGAMETHAAFEERPMADAFLGAYQNLSSAADLIEKGQIGWPPPKT